MARRICIESRAVRFTLDEWMLRLYTLPYDHPDYGPKAERVRDLIWETAQQILGAGTDVVLDWSQWSRAKRAEWDARARSGGWTTVLHHIATPAEVAIERAASREDPHSHVITAAGVRHMEMLFEEPTDDEGFRIIRHVQ